VPSNADLGHIAERAQPLEQRFVASGVGAERLGAKQAAQWIERSGHMDITVGIDTTGHTTRSFYDGHGHPSC
jgi:hypothetical protein